MAPPYVDKRSLSQKQVLSVHSSLPDYQRTATTISVLMTIEKLPTVIDCHGKFTHRISKVTFFQKNSLSSSIIQIFLITLLIFLLMFYFYGFRIIGFMSSTIVLILIFTDFLSAKFQKFRIPCYILKFIIIQHFKLEA